MPVVLLSGMGLWRDWETNPSWDAVEMAEPSLPDGWDVRKVKLPVSWTRCSQPLAQAWTSDVGAVIGFGVWVKGEKFVRVERVAVNVTNPDVRDEVEPSPKDATRERRPKKLLDQVRACPEPSAPARPNARRGLGPKAT